MTASTTWEHILDDDERILWQGKPDGAIVLHPRNIFGLLFGLFFSGFALFWMIGAAQGGGLFWMFGLLHFAVGLGIVFGAVGWGAFKRRRSWYTLTDRRAFIATSLPLRGNGLKSYPIGAGTQLELVDGPLATVNFHTETKRGENGSYEVPVGFERIADGQKVFRLMRDIQIEAEAGREGERTTPK